MLPLLSIAIALSQPDGAIVWDAPASACPTAVQLETQVIRMAGRLPGPSELQVRARVRPDGGQWRLELETVIDGRQQRRTHTAQTCELLAKATALVVAVSVDPVATASSTTVRSEPAEVVPAPQPTVEVLQPAQEPSVEPAPAEPAFEEPPTRPANRRVRGLFGVGGGLMVGATPGVSGGPALSLGLSFGLFRAEVRGRYWAPRLVTEGDGVGALVQGGAAGLVMCVAPQLRPVSFPLCAGFEAGAMRAAGRGVDNGRVQNWPWLATVLSAGLRWWALPDVALGLDVEVPVPVVDNQVVLGPTDIDEPRVIYAPPTLGVRALAGVELRFGRPQ